MLILLSPTIVYYSSVFGKEAGDEEIKRIDIINVAADESGQPIYSGLCRRYWKRYDGSGNDRDDGVDRFR